MSVSTLPPAFSKASAESYSQLVPGNTGINTRGRGAEVWDFIRAAGPANGWNAAAASPWSALVENTFSSGFSHACWAAVREMSASGTAITGCAVVRPSTRYSMPANASAARTPLASSSTREPCSGRNSCCLEIPDANAKPTRLPKAIVLTAAAIPPLRTVRADTTCLWATRSAMQAKILFTAVKSGMAAASRGNGTQTTSWPASLNSGDMTRPASAGATANATSVGGTSRSLKEPDMLSLPPMAATLSCCWAHSAPSTALKGLPQRTSSRPSFSKYSCKVSRTLAGSPPIATILATASVTAYTAPWNGLHSERYGLKPWAISVAVVVSPACTGNLAAIPSAGVAWNEPPNGMRIVEAPMVLSNRSTSPR